MRLHRVSRLVLTDRDVAFAVPRHEGERRRDAPARHALAQGLDRSGDSGPRDLQPST